MIININAQVAMSSKIDEDQASIGAENIKVSDLIPMSSKMDEEGDSSDAGNIKVFNLIKSLFHP